MSEPEEKKESNNVTISLPLFHRRKLATLQEVLGVNRSGIIQRLIENQSIFTLGQSLEVKTGDED